MCKSKHLLQFFFKDTAVGLDAISRYATLVNKKEPKVKVTVMTNSETKVLDITKRDRTKLETLPLVTYPNKVKANIEGEGCVSLQVTEENHIYSCTINNHSF